MENKEWNPRDWQGKSKNQIESSYKIMGWTLLGMVIFGIIGYLINFLN